MNEVHKPIVRQRGYFIKGKYDQFQRNIPFSAFVKAFRDLMGQLLSENDLQLQIWKAKILEVLGDNSQVIIDVIPELERILGQQPPAPEVSGTAAQNRFNFLFAKFIQVFTTKEHPLVMFLDDLQWADSASLKLIQLLMGESQTGYLLLIGAYRDNEVFPVHPLMLTLDEVGKAGATVNTMTLQPLSETSLNQLVADTLSCMVYSAQPLTQLIYQKTQGNPFFATQFLKSLHQDKFITFDIPAGYWQCDISQVREAALTDDVVEFMAIQLQKLPTMTQEVLKLAACIGNQFDLATLAIVSEQSELDAADALWKALQEGLVIPQNEVYKFYVGQNQQNANAVTTETVAYRFLHDRVQQAAYSLIPEEQKKVTHYRIGQRLLKSTSESDREERIFEIVNHLDIAVKLIEQPAEQEELAKLNLIAGRKAQNSTAYSAAVKYFAVGRNLLASDRWQSQYNLTLALYVEATEAAYLNTDIDEMERLAEVVIQQAKTALDTVKVYGLRINAYTSQGQFLEAINTGLTILKQLDINLPESPDLEDVVRVSQKTQDLLGSKKPADLLNLPEMMSPQILAVMEILNQISVPAYLTKPNLNSSIIMTQMNLSMTYGNAPISALGYSSYGLFLCAVVGDIDQGYEFGQLALNLLSKFKEKKIEARVLFVTTTFIIHWKIHLRETLKLLQNAYSSGWESGSLMDLGYAAYVYGFHAYFTGYELSKLEQEMTAYSKVLAQINQQSQLNYNELYRQSILNLLGETASRFLLFGEADQEQELLARYQQTDDQTGLWHFFLLKLMLCYLFEEFEQALEYIELAEHYSGGGTGMCNIPVLHFYASLTRLAVLPNSPKSESENLLQQVAASQKNMEKWATYASMNHLHKFYLVEAERHRVLGEKTAAIEMYDRAISGAKENGYIQEEAVANELAAKFYLDWGKEKVAQAYMTEAYYSYASWGAKAKVEDLETRYPQLIQPLLQQPQTSFDLLATLVTITHSTTQVDRTSISDALDFASVIKAAQTLSSEIELDELVKQLTQIILQNSGADKCILVLPENETWQVKAISTPETTELCSEPLDDCPNVPIKLIQYVKRMQSVVVIDNLQTDLPIIDDYLTQRQPKSVLCLPILDRGHLAGILYLKNRSTAGVFTSSRLTVINFLCTQAAISLENARLYQQSQQALVELQASKLRFQKLADNLPGMIFQFRIAADGSTSIPYVSSGCAALCEVPAEDFLNGVVNFQDIEHPDDRAAFSEALMYSAQTLTPFIQELRILTPLGNVKWVQIASQPEQQADGAMLWDGVVLDISDRKQAEKEKSRLLAILESTSDLVGIADDAGNNLYLNQAGQQLLQIPAAQMNQFQISEVTAPCMVEAMQTEILPTTMREGIWSGESILCSRGGEEIPVSQVIMAHKNAQGEVEFLSTIVRDIRDRKRAEAAITEKSQELSQALQNLQHTQLQMIQSEKMSALGNLVAGIAHEINNPVGFISGNLNEAQQTLQDLVEHLNLYREQASPVDIANHAENIDLDYIIEDLPKMIDSMKLGCDRIKGISTSLRTFSRADTDHPVACNIHDGIDSTLMILKHRLKANETRPEVQVVKEYGNLPLVECHAGQLNQVFMNLLANAIDALDESNSRRSYAEIEENPNFIKITTSLENNYVKIAISDNGKGIPEVVKERIFDHLFTTKGVGKGTGLGLAIARQIIVEKHSGSIHVNSLLGAGTEFIITLPTKASQTS